MTLAGSLALAVAEADLLTAVDRVATRHRPIALHNAGVQRLAEAVIAFDVHDIHGLPNVPLVELAADVTAAVRPLLRPTELLPADVRDRKDWRGHLSLASHELIDRADLRDEIEEFVHQLAVPYPAAFAANRLAVYRLHHPSWSPGWWADFRWEHVRSFSLAPTDRSRTGDGCSGCSGAVRTASPKIRRQCS